MSSYAMTGFSSFAMKSAMLLGMDSDIFGSAGFACVLKLETTKSLRFGRTGFGCY